MIDRSIKITRAALLVIVAGIFFACSEKSAAPSGPTTTYIGERGQAGAMVGHSVDTTHADYVKSRRATLDKQQKEIERQKREVEDLQRQILHNESLRRYEQ